MRLFWDKGYADTSMDDLVKATGVSRYGIYGTFGNKREVFVQALRRYAHGMMGIAMTDLSKPDASVAEIRAFFEHRLQVAAKDDPRMGCMICNTATQVAPHDEEIAAAIRQLFSELAALFERALKNGQRQGELAKSLDPKATSFYLVGVLQGLAVMARAGFTAKEAKSYVATALGTLR